MKKLLLAIVLIVGCSDTYELHRREWSGLIDMEYQKTHRDRNRYYFHIWNNTKYEIDSIHVEWDINNKESGKFIISRQATCTHNVSKNKTVYKHSTLLPFSKNILTFCSPIPPPRLDDQIMDVNELKITKVFAKK